MGELRESKEKIFSMDTWDTEMVLDALECIYTGSFSHVGSNERHAHFYVANLLHFLDVPITLKYVEFVSQQAIGPYNDSDKMDLDLIVCVWMVEEVFVEWRGMSAKVISNFCEGFFKNPTKPEKFDVTGKYFLLCLLFFFFPLIILSNVSIHDLRLMFIQCCLTFATSLPPPSSPSSNIALLIAETSAGAQSSSFSLFGCTWILLDVLIT